MVTLLYIAVLVLELVFLIGFSSFVLSILFSSFMGAPYVPTRRKEIDFILKELNPVKGKNFWELGCGDGRITRAAVKDYNVRGFGIDINPFLVRWARFLAQRQSLKNCSFITKNIVDIDLSKADYVYLFLLPDFLAKLMPKFKKELKKGSIIVSHGFRLEGLQRKLLKTIPHTPFPTYFYRM